MTEPDHHRLDVTVANADADLVVDRIWLTDPLAVGESEAPGDRTQFTVGYADRAAAEEAMERLAAWHPIMSTVRPDDWVDTWRAGAEPQVAGPFRIRLPEHVPADDGIDIEIEPGPTFGFGHPSTLLALELLAMVDLDGALVADVGSGSGVLAIAAALRGASAVHAVDIAADAVAATTANADRNGVAITSSHGSVDVLAPEVFDVVLVNVTAATQAAVLPQLRPHLGPTTSIVLSGLLDGQERIVAGLLPDHEIVDTRQRDGWIAVLLVVSRIASP